ncbi:hypothetical protein PR048_022161 [Dryococelus australis]|uniref:Ribosomal protein S3 n=1 Tax=Dryococelus australis TaxID=614101 RepID=A0ABQ9H0A4_9NEOP|nr:hypothetical protein PR048_022161 [Dryococelus australis]
MSIFESPAQDQLLYTYCIPAPYVKLTLLCASSLYSYVGFTSDEALEVRASVARIAPSLLDLSRVEKGRKRGINPTLKRTEVKQPPISPIPVGHASKMLGRRSPIKAWYPTRQSGVQPIGDLSQRGVANQAHFPFPEPRTASQRAVVFLRMRILPIIFQHSVTRWQEGIRVHDRLSQSTADFLLRKRRGYEAIACKITKYLIIQELNNRLFRELQLHKGPRWRSGQTTRLPPIRTGFDSQRGRSQILAWDLSLALAIRRCYYSPRFTLIGSQELNFKSCPDVFTHSLQSHTPAKWRRKPATTRGNAVRQSAPAFTEKKNCSSHKVFLVQAVHGKVSSFETNISKRSLLLPAYVASKVGNDGGKVVPCLNVVKSVSFEFTTKRFGAVNINKTRCQRSPRKPWKTETTVSVPGTELCHSGIQVKSSRSQCRSGLKWQPQKKSYVVTSLLNKRIADESEGRFTGAAAQTSNVLAFTPRDTEEGSTFNMGYRVYNVPTFALVAYTKSASGVKMEITFSAIKLRAVKITCTTWQRCTVHGKYANTLDWYRRRMPPDFNLVLRSLPKYEYGTTFPSSVTNLTGRISLRAPVKVYAGKGCSRYGENFFEMNLRKKSLPLYPYILMGALSGIRPVDFESAHFIMNSLYNSVNVTNDLARTREALFFSGGLTLNDPATSRPSRTSVTVSKIYSALETKRKTAALSYACWSLSRSPIICLPGVVSASN